MIEIRDAQLADAQAIAEVENFAYRDLDPDLRMEGHRLQTAERVHFAMASNGERGVIAQDEGEVRGVAMWRPIGDPVTTSYLHLLFVHPDYQRLGLGVRLLHIYWERNLAAWPTLTLFSLNCNRKASWALHFYARHGYQIYEPGDESRVAGLSEYLSSPPTPGRPIQAPYWALHYLPTESALRQLRQRS